MLEKTLEFLKQQTGHDFEYRNGLIKCNGLMVYNTLLKTAYTTKCCRYGQEKIRLTLDGPRSINSFTKMEPSEFIDKIAKGEWV